MNSIYEVRILIVDDNKDLLRLLCEQLSGAGYRHIQTAANCAAAKKLFAAEIPELMILDINLPDGDGFSLFRALHAKADVPALFLSARDADADRLFGLGLGADDYLTKPFHLEELEARIRSLTRRRFTQNNVVLNCGKVAFDTKARVAVADGQELSLTRKEIGILEYLLLNQGRPVSQEELLDHVWDNSVDNFSNSIRVHISALRKKLRAVLGYDPIRNRIGEGYVMEEEKV